MKLATVYVRRSSPVVIERSERVVFDGVAQRKVPQVIRYEVPQERVAEHREPLPPRATPMGRPARPMVMVAHRVIGQEAHFTMVSITGRDRANRTVPLHVGQRTLIGVGYRDYGGNHPYRAHKCLVQCSCGRRDVVSVHDWRLRRDTACIRCGHARSRKGNRVAPAADKTLPFHPKAGA